MKNEASALEHEAVDRPSATAHAALNGIIASAMDAIVCLDEQENILLCNRAAEAMFGVQAKELIGRGIGCFIPESFRAALKGYIEQFDKTGISSRFAEALESITCKRAGGEESLIEAFIAQIVDGGKRLFIVILRDTNSRKAAEAASREQEQRLRLAMDTAALGFYERDLISDAITVDSTWRDIMGLPEGQPTPDFAPKSLLPEDRERVLGLVSRAFDPNLQEVVAADFRVVRPNGQVRWVAGRGRVVFDNTTRPPKPLKFLGVLQDITARKEDEIALAEARSRLMLSNVELESRVKERTDRLLKANAEMEAFCYSLSHDMRSPLRAIVSFTEIVQQESGDRLARSSKGYLEQVTAAARRLDQMINDVLAFSRISNRKVEMRPVNVQRLLRDVISDAPQFHTPAAEIVIESALTPVLGDEASLTQCFANLLGNAVKFVPEGLTPQIRIFNQVSGDKVRIWVQDNGIGVEAGAQQRIFDLFERGQKVRQYEGTGIGLAIVARAVERMGGKVGVESEPGKGSRFWIELTTAPRSGEVQR